GFGNILKFSPELIVPDPGRTLREGAMRPWAGSWRKVFWPRLEKLARERSIPLDVPWSRLAAAHRRLLMEGGEGFRGAMRFLERVDLGYLTLDRLARTLSGGEAQRIELANALGARLTDTLYVLDEPTVGLHPRDTHRLVEILDELAGRGNTLVVVEHEPI